MTGNGKNAVPLKSDDVALRAARLVKARLESRRTARAALLDARAVMPLDSSRDLAASE